MQKMNKIKSQNGCKENHKNELHIKRSEMHLSGPSVWSTIMECRLNAMNVMEGELNQNNVKSTYTPTPTHAQTQAHSNQHAFEDKILLQFRCVKYLIKLIVK